MAQKYKVKVTRQALEQMQEIVDYITHELFAPEAANNLLDEMEKTVKSLETMPKRKVLVEEEPWKAEGIRKAVVKNFLIYFWIDEKKKIVQVIAVIYEKRNQIGQLKKITCLQG